MLVDCAYRFKEDGEIFSGKFDTVAGLVCKQDLIKPIKELTEIEYVKSNYEDPHVIFNIKELYNYMMKSSNILLTVDLNDICVIAVRRDGYSIWSVKYDNYLSSGVINSDPFSYRVVPVGIRRARVYTFDYFQPMCYVYAIVKNDNYYVITEDGIARVNGKLLPYDKIDKTGYRDLVFNKQGFYSTCVTSDGVAFLKFDEVNRVFNVIYK